MKLTRTPTGYQTVIGGELFTVTSSTTHAGHKHWDVVHGGEFFGRFRTLTLAKQALERRAELS